MIRQGWISLASWITFGILIEGLIGYRTPALLDDTIRRANPGLNRVSWDLRPTEDVLIKYGGDDPKKFVPSGEYTAELSYGKEKMKQTFHVEIAAGIATR